MTHVNKIPIELRINYLISFLLLSFPFFFLEKLKKKKKSVSPPFILNSELPVYSICERLVERS